MIDPASSWLEVMELPTITRVMTNKVNGKERTIEEEIFDKSSDQIARLVNKIWLCRYPRCHYLIYDNGSEFNLHFETLCGSCVRRKPTTIKNPTANAICERVHQILETLMRTSEIDMANSVEPAYTLIHLSTTQHGHFAKHTTKYKKPHQEQLYLNKTCSSTLRS